MLHILVPTEPENSLTGAIVEFTKLSVSQILEITALSLPISTTLKSLFHLLSNFVFVVGGGVNPICYSVLAGSRNLVAHL